VYPSGFVVPRDVGSAGVGLVHGHWFFWVVWFVRLRVRGAEGRRFGGRGAGPLALVLLGRVIR
jgi:hypothetical protein